MADDQALQELEHREAYVWHRYGQVCLAHASPEVRAVAFDAAMKATKAILDHQRALRAVAVR